MSVLAFPVCSAAFRFPAFLRWNAVYIMTGHNNLMKQQSGAAAGGAGFDVKPLAALGPVSAGQHCMLHTRTG
jgi:hypothetical protein